MYDGSPKDSSREMDSTDTSSLEYVFFIYNAVFNSIGQTFLRLTVQNDIQRPYTGIAVSKNNTTFQRKRSALTDVITQQLPGRTQEFANHKFTFLLPAGYCKNNNAEKHVNLLVEAFVIPPKDKCLEQTTPEKIGEGRLVIFPRPEVPHEQIEPFPGREIYSMTDVMSLNWSNREMNDAANNYGHIKFSAILMYSKLKEANPDNASTTRNRRVPDKESLRQCIGLSQLKEERTQENKIKPKCIAQQLPRAATSTPLPPSPRAVSPTVSLTTTISLRDTAENEPAPPLTRNPAATDVAPLVVEATANPLRVLEARLQDVKHELSRVEQELAQLKSKHSGHVCPVIEDGARSRGWKNLHLLHVKLQKQRADLERKRTAEKQVKADVEQHKKRLSLVHGELTRWIGQLAATHTHLFYQLPISMDDSTMPKKEARKDLWKSARKNVPKKVGKKVEDDVEKQVMMKNQKNVSQKAGNKTGKDVGKELAKSAWKKVGEAAEKGIRKELNTETGKEATQEVGNNVAKDFDNEPGKEDRKEVGKEFDNEVGKEGEEEVEKGLGKKLKSKAGKEDGKEGGRGARKVFDKDTTEGVGEEIRKIDGKDVEEDVKVGIWKDFDERGKEVRKKFRNGVEYENVKESGREFGKDVQEKPRKHGPHDRTSHMDNLEVNLLDLVHTQIIELDSYRMRVDELTTKVVQLEEQGKNVSQQAMPKDDSLDRNVIDLLNTKLSELSDTRLCIGEMKSDIRILQETVKQLTFENDRLQFKCKEKKDEICRLIESEKHNGKEAALMKTKLAEITFELKAYKDQVHGLHNKLIKYKDLEKECLQLQQVQDSYCNVQAKLNEKITRISKLEEACRIQHHIIADIQHYRTKGGGGSGNPIHRASEALRLENSRLKEEIVLLLQEKTRDEHNARNSRTNEIHKMDVLSKITMSRLQLIQRLYQRQTRMRALEKQMADNAAAWGREKAELLVRLHEKTNNTLKCASCQMTKIMNVVTNDKPATTKQQKGPSCSLHWTDLQR